MVISKTWSYDYANRCECSDDDNCGCSYPNNMARGFSAEYNFSKSGGIMVGDNAPNFTAPAVLGDDNVVNNFHFLDYIVDSYALLMFYHADFSAVCPHEITAFNHAAEQFKKRGVKLIAVSVDSVAAHLVWRRLSFAEGGIGKVSFPLISDVARKASATYGVLGDDGFAERTSFLIDRNFKVRYMATYDAKISRNVEETLRVIDEIIKLDETECNGLDCWMRRPEITHSFSNL